MSASEDELKERAHISLSGLEDAGAVVIGRDLGERLRPSLASVAWLLPRAIYSDSGSSDARVALARGMGFLVVTREPGVHPSAARGRNGGFAALIRAFPGVRHVQIVDGDTRVHGPWLLAARAYLERHQDVSVVSGYGPRVACEDVGAASGPRVRAVLHAREAPGSAWGTRATHGRPTSLGSIALGPYMVGTDERKSSVAADSGSPPSCPCCAG